MGPLSRVKTPRVQADSSHQHGRGSEGLGRAGNALLRSPTETSSSSSSSSAEATPNVTPGGAAGDPQGRASRLLRRRRPGSQRTARGKESEWGGVHLYVCHVRGSSPPEQTPHKRNRERETPAPAPRFVPPLPEPEVAPCRKLEVERGLGYRGAGSL